MTTLTLDEVQARLPDLIRRLQPGEAVTILDYGEPTAVVTKAGSPAIHLRPPPGLGRGMIKVVSDDEDHLADFAEHMP